MYERLFDSTSDLRVGDAEREATADRLRTAHAEGRLDADELQERIDRCLKAKTGRELRELVADLPSQIDRRNPGSDRWLPGHMRLVPFVVMIVAVVALTSVVHHGWFALLGLLFLARFLFYRRHYWGRAHL